MTSIAGCARPWCARPEVRLAPSLAVAASSSRSEHIRLWLSFLLGAGGNDDAIRDAEPRAGGAPAPAGGAPAHHPHSSTVECCWPDRCEVCEARGATCTVLGCRCITASLTTKKLLRWLMSALLNEQHRHRQPPWPLRPRCICVCGARHSPSTALLSRPARPRRRRRRASARPASWS